MLLYQQLFLYSVATNVYSDKIVVDIANVLWV